MHHLLLLVILMSASALAADPTSPDPATSTGVVAGDPDLLIKSGDKAFLENDFSGAEAQYIEAMKQGSEEAVRKLFITYTTDRNPHRMTEQEAGHKIAELGHPEYMVMLGHDYRNGRGVEKSDEEAAKWYRRAAEQRYAWAASLLAEMYGMGMGVEQDMQEAYVWARLSEEWKTLPSNANWNSGAPTPDVKLSEQIAKELASSEQRRAEAEVKNRMEDYEKQAEAQ